MFALYDHTCFCVVYSCLIFISTWLSKTGWSNYEKHKNLNIVTDIYKNYQHVKIYVKCNIFMSRKQNLIYCYNNKSYSLQEVKYRPQESNKFHYLMTELMQSFRNLFFYPEHLVPEECNPDLPHISVQHSAWVEGGKAAAVGGLLRRVQLEWLWRTACTRAHSREGEKKEQRFRGDLDYFRFSSFKSQHHLSNLMLDDFVEIYSRKTNKQQHTAKTIFLLLSLSNASSIW